MQGQLGQLLLLVLMYLTKNEIAKKTALAVADKGGGRGGAHPKRRR